MNIRGNQVTGLLRTHGGTIEFKDDGSVEAKEKFICRWESIPSVAPKRNSSLHPDFNSLTCVTCTGTKLRAGVAELYATYSGYFVSPTVPGGEESIDDWVQELVATTRSEPIETHPEFESSLGGTALGPINGAIYDSDGIFKGFKQDSLFAGIKSYLVPTVTYRLTRSSSVKPSGVSDIGQISTPAVSISIPAGSSWLLTSRSWRRNGGIYTVSEEWLLSGKNGWDVTIYA